MKTFDILGGSQLHQTPSLGLQGMHPPPALTALLLSFAGKLQEKIGECCLGCGRLLVRGGQGGKWEHSVSLGPGFLPSSLKQSLLLASLMAPCPPSTIRHHCSEVAPSMGMHRGMSCALGSGLVLQAKHCCVLQRVSKVSKEARGVPERQARGVCCCGRVSLRNPGHTLPREKKTLGPIV